MIFKLPSFTDSSLALLTADVGASVCTGGGGLGFMGLGGLHWTIATKLKIRIIPKVSLIIFTLKLWISELRL